MGRTKNSFRWRRPPRPAPTLRGFLLDLLGLAVCLIAIFAVVYGWRHFTGGPTSFGDIHGSGPLMSAMNSAHVALYNAAPWVAAGLALLVVVSFVADWLLRVRRITHPQISSD